MCTPRELGLALIRYPILASSLVNHTVSVDVKHHERKRRRRQTKEFWSCVVYQSAICRRCLQTTTSLCWLSQCDKLCLGACMGIKRTCFDAFPPGHPKMFERTLNIILVFVLAISNTINLFPNFLCCSL